MEETLMDVESTAASSKGALVDLDEATCWSLLGRAGIGRLSWASGGKPFVVPVNYRVSGGRLEIITAAYSLIARECDDAFVAFEADSTDAEQHAGWSVLVQGTAALDFQHPSSDGPRPWPAGVRRQRLVITPSSVTGRRVL